MRYPRPAAPLASRRQFLRRAGAVAVTLLPASALWAAQAPVRRSLSFVHTHTGEQVSSVYFQDGRYVDCELQRINWLMRDFRTGDVHPIEPGVLDLLADLRALANRDDTFEIICGYRSPHTNAMLHRRSSGVAEHSLHLEGRAVDVRLSGFPTSRLHGLALAMNRGGVGFYPASDFVHVDTGRVRHW